MTTTTSLPGPSAAFLADLKRNAQEIRSTDKSVEKLMARRNALWVKAIDAGMKPGEVGAIFGLEAQTVRLAVGQTRNGVTLKSRNARYRGLKRGGRTAAK